MIARELMTTNPMTVRADTTIKAALTLLDEHDITSLPVVTPDGRICGVVSEADLIRDLVTRDPRSHLVPSRGETVDRHRIVGEVMSRHAVTVSPDTDVEAVVELTTTMGIKSLPVVDDHDRVVGVISRRDVVHMLARTDETLEREVDALLLAAGVRDWLVEVQDGVAEITGPADARGRALAEAVAGSVPGVVEVRVA